MSLNETARAALKTALSVVILLVALSAALTYARRPVTPGRTTAPLLLKNRPRPAPAAAVVAAAPEATPAPAEPEAPVPTDDVPEPAEMPLEEGALEATVSRVVQEVIASGQLDSCDISLSEVRVASEELAEALRRMLMRRGRPVPPPVAPSELAR